MNEDRSHKELVEQAKNGDRESLDTLARLAEKKLRPYIYRVTLDQQLSDDVLQEVLLQK